MTKLEELIEKLCPDGVEYKTLGEVAQYAKTRIDASKMNEKNYVGVENLLQEKRGKTTASSVPVSGKVIAFESGDVLIGNIRPYLKKIWLADCAGGTNGDVLAVQINDRSLLMPEYLYYVLSSDQFFLYDTQNSKGTKMPRGSKEAVMKYNIPVPPLEVQQEIVRILDSFTELEKELEKELEDRRKQYEYYRDLLLTFKPNESTILNERTNELEINAPVSWLKLGECCVVQSGGTPSKKNADYWLNGKIKWLSSSVCQNKKEVTNITGYITEEGLKHSSAKIMNKGTTLIALVGATIGKRAFLQYEAAINQNIAGIYPKNKNLLLPEYIYYISETLYEKFLGLTNGKLAMANLSFVRNLEIPVPQLEQQQRIVDILDCFDTLCNDISSGLPAEIEARQKQYEYYRDKLLTFKKLKKEA